MNSNEQFSHKNLYEAVNKQVKEEMGQTLQEVSPEMAAEAAMADLNYEANEDHIFNVKKVEAAIKKREDELSKQAQFVTEGFDDNYESTALDPELVRLHRDLLKAKAEVPKGVEEKDNLFFPKDPRAN